MPERLEIVQRVTEEENLGARVYPKSIEVFPRRMKKLMSGFLWERLEALPSLAPRPYPRSSLGPREGRGREMGDCERGDQGRESAGA